MLIPGLGQRSDWGQACFMRAATSHCLQELLLSQGLFFSSEARKPQDIHSAYFSVLEN